MGKYKRTEELLPYSVIKEAAEGNVDAAMAVLKHYDAYIRKMATQLLYDDLGDPHWVVDEALRQQLEAKLLEKVLSFRLKL